MKKRKMRARIRRLEKDCALLDVALVEFGEVLVKYKDEIAELQMKRLTREEISEVADRVNRLLTGDK